LNKAVAAVTGGEIKPLRKWGQNFLTDRSVAQRIVQLADLTPDDHVIEVGPGVCSLTGLLCDRAHSVTAVEIDGRLTQKINEAMTPYNNFTLINADILTIAPNLLIPPGGGFQKKNIKFISNMPYNISTPLMTRLFEEFAFAGRAVLMMQREVSDKIIAKPSTPDYCMLTVFANSFAAPERAFFVPPHCFAPQPAVGSAVVAFDAHEKAMADTVSGELFFRVVRAAFASRRKTLENCLVRAGLAASRPEAAGAIARAGISAGARGESSPSQAKYPKSRARSQRREWIRSPRG
jgi:16S rRNA (adenine1518-N6/adenine1519-N6)-dimethyltransferase